MAALLYSWNGLTVAAHQGATAPGEALAPSSDVINCSDPSLVSNQQLYCQKCGASKIPLKDGSLTTRREWFEAQKNSDPDLIRLLYASTKAEVGSQGGAAAQAYMESVFNRAAATGKNLRGILLDPGYYPDATKNKLNDTVQDSSGVFAAALQNVISGSNISDFATDNASADLAENRRAAGNPWREFGGELFYVNKNGSGSGGVPAHAAFYEKAKAVGCSAPPSGNPMDLSYNPVGSSTSAQSYPSGGFDSMPPASSDPSQGQIGNGQQQEDLGGFGAGGMPGGSGGAGGGSSSGSRPQSDSTLGASGESIGSSSIEAPQIDTPEMPELDASLIRNLAGPGEAPHVPTTQAGETLGFTGPKTELNEKIRTVQENIKALESSENPEDRLRLNELKAKVDLLNGELRAVEQARPEETFVPPEALVPFDPNSGAPASNPSFVSPANPASPQPTNSLTNSDFSTPEENVPQKPSSLEGSSRN